MKLKKFDDFEHINENLDLLNYFKNGWSKDPFVIDKIKSTPSLRSFIPYLEMSDDEWDSVSQEGLATLWRRWDELDKEINEFYRATGRNVGQREYQRQRKELLDSLIGRLSKASLEQLEQIKYILGW